MRWHTTYSQITITLERNGNNNEKKKWNPFDRHSFVLTNKMGPFGWLAGWPLMTEYPRPHPSHCKDDLRQFFFLFYLVRSSNIIKIIIIMSGTCLSTNKLYLFSQCIPCQRVCACVCVCVCLCPLICVCYPSSWRMLLEEKGEWWGVTI